MLNKHSGLVGISGVSGDVREVLSEVKNGSERAALAMKIYGYRIRKYIGAYAGAMGGLDAVVFTAGVGQHAPSVRREACVGLEFLGLVMDDAANESATSGEHTISARDSRVSAVVIPTNEELAIALETERLTA
jgi:acetate kinase